MRLDATGTTDLDPAAFGSGAASPAPALVFLCPETSRSPLPLTWTDEEPRVIGREEDSAICLPGTDVSRRHASLQRSADGELTLVDLESRNGTHVNGAAIRVKRLALGDVVRIGGWVGVIANAPQPVAEIAPGLFGGGLLERTIAPLRTAAQSDLPVVLEGETGTGKEVVARALHTWSGRSGPFVGVNCAALPEGLAEAELFGYRRGAFTGADRASSGFFRSADGGTLLLDEIQELPLALQAKLLRVLEQREVQPLGEARAVPFDVRIVVAGQESLLDAVKERRFRADLLARLDGLSLRLPPLRTRREDVPALFSLLWTALGGGNPPVLEFDFVERLVVYDWPLNVRELVLLVRRLRVFCANEPSLRARHLPERIGDTVEKPRPPRASAEPPARENPSEPEAATSDRIELPELMAALRASQGNVARASTLLGITRQ
ncbi:MAG TPA: sigma 54-interacting transcriptional regulator, partial [Polyangiaceae bacterium]|nr:sigma 54-interacting transcriptional regulator [Polyangiaceae bacterium]